MNRHDEGKDMTRGHRENSMKLGKAETHVESMLCQKLMVIVRMSIQVVNMLIQISKLKKEEKALRRSF